ncbi:MAG: membrane integrity-associated transporter subunit PqiC [Leptospirales bacterium]|nr:membrane integrity-associated transporter subunit PqiC [Leptospirales bacterium]
MIRIAATLVSLILAGCISTERDSPQKHFYILETTRPKSEAGPTLDAVLKFRKFKVSPRFDTRNLIYRTGDVTYETDFYNEFISDPGSMISESTRMWMTESGNFKAVVDGSSSLAETFVLEGTVQEIYGDFRGQPAAVISLHVFLLAADDSEYRIVFQKVITTSLPLQGKNSESLIRGFNQTLSKQLTELEHELVGAARTYISQRKSLQNPAPNG